ncbi:energy transducer TonB [Candidatus Neomarinimicrobiota bacterium]
MKRLAPISCLSGWIVKVVVLIGTSILILISCAAPKLITPGYVPPKILLDSFITFYPSEAYLEKMEGKVILLMYIEKNGYVGKAAITSSSGYDILDSTALSIARTVRLSPGLINGEPAEFWMTWPIIFRLSSAPIFTIDLEEWRQTAHDLQVTAVEGSFMKRIMAQDNLLGQYLKVSKLMAENHSIIPNKTIMELVASPIRDFWIEYQDVWPLEFVLFQDFIYRFPDSWFIPRAKTMHVDYMRNEIAQLREASMARSPIALRRRLLLDELTRFLGEYYPEALGQESTFD